MADQFPPTTADYAWADALKARDEARTLEQRLVELTARVDALEAALDRERSYRLEQGR